ncbi:hypothetical protein Mal15_53930 [Stieleria maiorica]|uniref:Uncharacterized protein n=1 Tax=Stieleria maiorica TaxID=2795974 RepID=A0A5B9MN22_9BACT|nr:hypothetical protein [Stieleria maiorica]QEG01317.1 hypothetical protein Mal15_53930 [Stieleria maiorica]
MSKSNLHDNRISPLWAIVSAPAIWAMHFLASYMTAAVFCAKFADSDGSAGEVQLAVMIYTVIALLLIVAIAVIGFRHHHHGRQFTSHDDSGRDAQRRMIGFSTFLLALLSAVATVFTALVLVFVGTCH